ncbi:MAG: OmpA family protein [Polyangiaceae bacterium]|nr:OmpA family protein [Polyangiaceae bacterium]
MVRVLSRAAASGLVLVSIGALVGCAETLPPKELVDARANYEKAANGPPQKLAPAQLDTAKQSLQKAERRFSDEEDTPETRALAYIADRRAMQASVAAEIVQANAERQAAENEYKDKSAAELEAARQAVQSGRQALEKEKDAREQAEKGRAEAEKARKEAERVAAAALASLKELASVKEEQRGVVITLEGSVLFATGKSNLMDIAKEKLNTVYKVLKDQNHPKLRIEGHTDSVGSAEENRKLSLARAESVKAQLVSQGYPADRIKTSGLGPDRPVADNGSPEGRANNRRVEIIVNPKDW